MTDHDDHNTDAAPTEQAGQPATEPATAEDSETAEEWSPQVSLEHISDDEYGDRLRGEIKT